MDNTGDFIWAKGMGGTGDDLAFEIDLDSTGNVYMTGYFSDTADFDPSAGTANLISLGGYDVFVSKLENDDVAPAVVSIVRANLNPTAATSVDFTVTFSESVIGVDMAGPVFDNFDLTTTGVIGASVMGASGSGGVYTVTVTT